MAIKIGEVHGSRAVLDDLQQHTVRARYTFTARATDTQGTSVNSEPGNR